MADHPNDAASAHDHGLGGYAESMAELESILASLEHDDVDIDTLACKVERASLLIAHCEQRLRATELSLETILAQHEPALDSEA